MPLYRIALSPPWKPELSGGSAVAGATALSATAQGDVGEEFERDLVQHSPVDRPSVLDVGINSSEWRAREKLYDRRLLTDRLRILLRTNNDSDVSAVARDDLWHAS